MRAMATAGAVVLGQELARECGCVQVGLLAGFRTHGRLLVGSSRTDRRHGTDAADALLQLGPLFRCQ